MLEGLLRLLSLNVGEGVRSNVYIFFDIFFPIGRGFILGIPISPEELAEAEDVDFVEEKEDWNVYKLSDGTTLKVKLVLTGVKRLKKWNPDGTPIYVINSQNIVRVVNVPKELKAKAKEPSFKPT